MAYTGPQTGIGPRRRLTDEERIERDRVRKKAYRASHPAQTAARRRRDAERVAEARDARRGYEAVYNKLWGERLNYTVGPSIFTTPLLDGLVAAAEAAGVIRVDSRDEGYETLRITVPGLTRVLHIGELAIAFWNTQEPMANHSAKADHLHSVACYSSIVERERTALIVTYKRSAGVTQRTIEIANISALVLVKDGHSIPLALGYFEPRHPPDTSALEQNWKDYMSKLPKYPLLAGERNPNAKLTEAEVGEIKARLSVGATQKEMAALFNVALMTINNIARGESWAWVQPAGHDVGGTKGDPRVREGERRSTTMDIDDPRLLAFGEGSSSRKR